MQRATAASAVEEAVDSCLRFLLDARSSAGCWTEWELPPGASSIWTTAYVGLQIHRLAVPLKARAAPALRSAARWLKQNELEGGGWGYSDQTGCDADSTANAVLFLRRSGEPVPAATYLRLLRFQHADGGFSTYGADEGLGSWGTPHVDVSAVAGLAVQPIAEAFERAVRYVVRGRRADGLWNSFWWSSPLYATRASLSLLQKLDFAPEVTTTRTTLQQFVPQNAFERALLLDALRLCGCAPAFADEVAATLAEEQLSDGSWQSAPILRVTDRACTTPWNSPDSGRMYADTDRLFTSATVLAALAGHLARDLGGGGAMIRQFGKHRPAGRILAGGPPAPVAGGNRRRPTF